MGPVMLPLTRSNDVPLSAYDESKLFSATVPLGSPPLGMVLPSSTTSSPSCGTIPYGVVCALSDHHLTPEQVAASRHW